jgi:hypothetical protein
VKSVSLALNIGEVFMPQRSNEFQDFIALLEKQLAPSGSKVHSSAMLKDYRTGENREVDILIETKSGIHPIRIGIEVIDHKRPASTPWIESISKKHEDLLINKSIAVSRSGFYRPALRKAEALKIDALTLKQAKDLDWKAKIDSMPSVSVDSFLLPYLTEVNVLFTDERAVSEFKECNVSELVIHSPSGEPQGTLSSILDKFLANKDVVNSLWEKAPPNTSAEVKARFRLEEGSYIIGSKGDRYMIYEIRFKAICRREKSEARLEKGRYRDAAVVGAFGKSFGHEVSMVFTETRGEDPSLSLQIKKPRRPKSNL